MSYQNGYSNGRSSFPRVIEVPLKEDPGSTLEIDCETLEEDTSELCEILNSEEVSLKYWIKFAFEYNRHGMVDNAIDMLQKTTARPRPDELHPIHMFLASLYMHKARDAPKATAGAPSNVQTRESLQQQAVGAINEAARINPTSILTLLNTGIQRLATAGTDKSVTDQILRLFDEVLKQNPNNVIALIGKARVHYGRNQFAIALRLYQKAMTARPDMNPDPRIGIGQCFWHLKMKSDARAAWERALELKPDSTSASVLLAMWYLDAAFQGVDIKTFTELYGKAMQYAQKAYKLSQHLASAALILSQYFYSKKNFTSVTKLAEKVLEYSDVAAISSDAYYWIGRTHHQLHQYDKAMAFYQRARSVNEANLPAAIGIGQLQVLQNDYISAKLSFERLLERHPKCIEALTILAFIYSNEVNDRSNKLDKSAEKAKAKGYFDKALKLIEETKGRNLDDPMLCLAQAQLCETDDIDVSLKLLEQAKELQVNEASPQLINNIAVLQHTKGDLSSAQMMYQSAWAETVKLGQEDGVEETEDMLITLSYNLGRLEEDAGNIDEAKKTYEGLLKNHPDYVDAVARLCYLDAIETSFDPSSKLLKDLLLIDPTNLESRALIGWHLSHQRRSRTSDDQEQKHFVGTLRHFDKHDSYSLISLANTYLRHARELRPQTETDKEKRKKEYARAVEMFQKALELQPKNAYAAQGVAIAFAEEKNYIQANMIFNKVKETLKDTSISINMGHCYADQRDWTRAIQNYETALEKSGKDEFNLLCCLGRVWLLRGREEKNAEFIRTSLDYTRRALALSPENVNVKFNIAFDQFQLADVLRETDPSKRTVEDIEKAASDLEAAIDSLSELAEAKQPPWPKDDLLQRATMGRNTLRRQLERALQQQKEYEQINFEKLEASRIARMEEAKRKEERAAQLAAEEAARQAKLAEEREQMQEQARIWAEEAQMKAEELAKAQAERKGARGKKSRKSRRGTPTDGDELDGEISDEENKEERPKRKRQVKRGNGRTSAISDERVVESEEEEVEDLTAVSGDDKPKSKKRKVLSQARIIDSEDEDEIMLDDAGNTANGGSVHEEESDDQLFGGEEMGEG